MIFINKNADYSDIKIGTVELPFTPSAETADILSHYTKVLSSKQTMLFDDFVKTLKQAGLLSLINHLYLPMLAGTPSEALYDYAADTEHAVAPGNGYYKIGTKGLITDKNAEGAELVYLGAEQSHSASRFFSFYKNGVITNTAMFSDNNFYVGGNGASILWSGNNYIVLVPDEDFVDGVNNLLLIATPSNNKFYASETSIYHNGVSKEIASTHDGNSYGSNHYNFMGSYNSATVSSNNDCLMYFDLRPVSAEEAGVINTAVNTLLSNFWD